jgi:voltage-gated sodium channel
MFVGTVINAMVDSVADMVIENKKHSREIRKKTIDREVERLTNADFLRNSDRNTKRTVRLIKLVFSGRTLTPGRVKVSGMMNRPSGFFEKIHDKYVVLVDVCAELVDSTYFQNFVTFIILVVCLQVGFQTNSKFDLERSQVVDFIDYFVVSVFAFEAGLKIIAEGSTPLAYFYSNWNKFDFIIVMLSILPTGNRSFVLMIRLLRLLRVLKLLRAFPKLQVIVTAILSSLISIFYIGVIITLFFYVYAIVGMILFSSNDPIHYGSLHIAMLTLFQIMTFDNWTPIELTNAYGCFAPVSTYILWFQEQCDTSSNGNFIAAFIYYYSFAVIAGMILISLFVGVVNVYMDISNDELLSARCVELKLKKVIEENNMDHYTVGLYSEVFNMLDFTRAGYISKTELRFGVDVSGNKVSDAEFKEIELLVDQNHDNKIDFSEFLKFAIDLKYQRNPQKMRKSNRKKLFYKSYYMMNTTTISHPEPSEMTEQERLEVVNDIQSAYQDGDLGEHEYQNLVHKYKDYKNIKTNTPLSVEQVEVSQPPSIFTWWFPGTTASATSNGGLEQAVSETEAVGVQNYISGLSEVSHLFSFLTPAKPPLEHVSEDAKAEEPNDFSETKSAKSLNCAYMADLPSGTNKVQSLPKSRNSSTDIVGYCFPDILKLAVCPQVVENSPNNFALKE